jgi:chromosome segregation ATPase
VSNLSLPLLTDTSKELQQQREEIFHLTRKTGQQQSQIDQLNAQLAQERRTKLSTENDVKRLTGELKKLNEDKDSLQQWNARLRTDLEEEKKTAQNAISMAENHTRQLTVANDQLTREVMKLNADKQSLQQQVSSAAEETTRQLIELQGAVDTLRGASEEQQRVIEQMTSEKEQLQVRLCEKEQQLSDAQQLLRNANAARERGESTLTYTTEVLNKSIKDLSLSDSELESGAVEADKLVTPLELHGLAKVVEGSWVEFALDLAPETFQIYGSISTIQRDLNYGSPRVKAQAMLETWKNKMHSEATRCVLIQALCKKGMKKQACNVFGDEVTNTVAP